MHTGLIILSLEGKSSTETGQKLRQPGVEGQLGSELNRMALCSACQQVHKDEDGHQYLYLQPCARRRPGHHHDALPEHRLPSQYLALWGGGVQGLHLHRLLQHVHQYLHTHHDECGSVRGRVPPCESPGFPHPHQSQDDQRLHLDLVLGCRDSCFCSGGHADK